jgi:hypothetical protein
MAGWARGGGGCFAAGTPVTVPGGRQVPIETLRVGDPIVSVVDGALVDALVVATATVEPPTFLELAAGDQTLLVTDEHPFFVGDGTFREARALVPGDRLFVATPAGLAPAAVRSVRKVPARGPAYNVLVSPGGTYLAGGVVVHNKGCFLPDTPILLEDGTEKPIGTVQAGDRILGLDATDHVVGASVVQIYSLDVDDYLVVKTTSAELHVTREHPFYVGHGEFKTVGSLAAGATVWARSGSGLAAQTIVSITPVHQRVRVYNLQTNSPHTYFVSGIAVHNKGGGGFGGGGGHGFGGSFHFGGSGSGSGSGSDSDDGVTHWVMVFGILVFLGCVIWYKSDRDEDARPTVEAPLDFTVDPVRARERDRESRATLEALGHEDPAFLPGPLDTLVRDTFLLLQRCWTDRDYGPLKDRLTTKLLEHHQNLVEGMKANHEVNRLEGLALEGLWFFQVNRRENQTPEVTVLFQARVKDYYVDDRNQRFLRGDSSVESFQEFWVFRLAPDGWRLAAIEQVTSESKRWGPGTVQAPKDQEFASIQTPSEPERRMALWAATKPWWAPGPLKDEIAARATALVRFRETWDLAVLDEADFGSELWRSLQAERDRGLAHEVRWEVRNFCVRSVVVVLARAGSRAHEPGVVCRLTTHAQTTVHRGSAVTQDPDLVVHQETWSLIPVDGTWKLVERRPFP